MKVCVIGAGYVGLTTSAVIADLGHEVICVDKDEQKICQLQKGFVPIYEPGLTELLQKNKDHLSFSTNVSEGIALSSVIIIAVGTPSLPDGSTDMTFINSVIEDLSSSITSYKTIVIKSTVPPGTNEKILETLAKNINRECFNVVSNPEFLKEGSAVYDMFHPDKTVIGTNTADTKSFKIIKQLYNGLDAPFIETSLTGAEMIKYASNAFLAMKISFINELARICEAFDVDITDVAKGIGTDPRIGNKFLQAGLGYGGSCFPKDVSSLHHSARTKKIKTPILEAVQEINNTQVDEYINKLNTLLPDLPSKKIGVLGIAFKPNTNDIRYSRATTVIEQLGLQGCKIAAYDPIAVLPDFNQPNISQVSTIENALEGADCIVIATDWDEFITLDWQQVKEQMKGNVVVDGRNCLNKEQLEKNGFRYVGVGRG